MVGRDARMSGSMLQSIVVGTLQGMGYDVVDIGLATTPTTEVAVVEQEADGGIILTASHNPREWNALKLLNSRGEFLSAEEGKRVLALATSRQFAFASVDELGKVIKHNALPHHIEQILALPGVDAEAVCKAGFKVVVDCINSVGGVALPPLFEALGVQEVTLINGEPTGNFAHNPEPLPHHLTELAEQVQRRGASVGFAVDPDVDRLAIYCENGVPFGEEYTLVAVADYLLREGVGQSRNTVSNLSSSRALRSVTEQHGGSYYAAAVGEVNVTTKMKEVGALIGGEGNGGVIYPAAHYGRDALVGIALFLTYMAKSGKTPSQLRAELPELCMVKERLELSPSTNVDALLQQVQNHYQGKAEVNTIDGVKLDFPDRWIHLRKSNTEPIIRIYAEAHTHQEATALVEEMKGVAKNFI